MTLPKDTAPSALSADMRRETAAQAELARRYGKS